MMLRKIRIGVGSYQVFELKRAEVHGQEKAIDCRTALSDEEVDGPNERRDNQIIVNAKE